jgi:hypothetical protein
MKRGRELFEELMRELIPPNWPPASLLGSTSPRLTAQQRWEQRQCELSAEVKQRAIDSVWEATRRHRDYDR